MKRREFIRAGAALAAGCVLTGASKGLHVEIWYGRHQRVGQLGDVQDDFNLLGHIHAVRPITSVTYSVNGGALTALRFTVFRRIVEYGDFNADIPVSSLHAGDNQVVIQATDAEGQTASAKVIVTREIAGAYPLPAKISWGSVRKLEDVGQCSDGRWIYGRDGLRTAEVGYDRIFLIGNRSWRDYQVTAPVTIHGFSCKNGQQSGTVHHTGFCLRWTGHSTEDNTPGEQPKWGLHPRGGIVWLTIRGDALPPVRQFYPGDSERWQTFAPFSVELGRPFWMKGRCQTLDGDGVTRYSFKVWNTVKPEPADWDFQVTQRSRRALRSGGLGLVAHETDATFGDLLIENVS